MSFGKVLWVITASDLELFEVHLDFFQVYLELFQVEIQGKQTRDY